MSNILSDVSYIVSFVIEIGVPLVLAIYMRKRYRTSWAIFFLGMLLFLVSLIRIPLNNLFSSMIVGNFSGGLVIILAGLFASFTAGIFEEGVRVLAFGVVIKQRSYDRGIMYGIGHGGGGESMIFVAMSTLATFIIYRIFPNILSADLIKQLAGVVWYMPLVGALERVFAIAIQISLSVLVMYAFLERKYYFILVAILYHMVIDFVAVYIGYKFGILLTEILVFIFAIVSVTIIYILRPRKK